MSVLTKVGPIFQFHKGTIKTSPSFNVSWRLFDFNSRKVRLKRNERYAQKERFQNFNSIKVRLKPPLSGEGIKNINNFNSIKVRLKHSCDATVYNISAFQFHKGTIKTCLENLVNAIHPIFQFHKGTIKTNVRTNDLSCFIISIP